MGGSALGGSLSRLGIMGGTFDPVHVGHLAAAEEVREALALERVLFVPAGDPPHKPSGGVTPVEHRIAMVALAIRGNPAFEVSRIEADRSGPSWTVDTVDALAAAETGAGRVPDLTLILSAESFTGLPSWHDPVHLLRSCRIAVVPRGGLQVPDDAWVERHFPGVPARVTRFDRPSCASPRPRSVPAWLRAGRSATSFRRQSSATSATMDCTGTCPAGGPMHEDTATVTDPGIAGQPGPSPDGLPKRSARPDGVPPTPVDGGHTPLELARRIVELAEDKKAADIVLLDLTGLTTVADYFVIASGGSERQLDAIADGIVETLRDEKVRPIGREGLAASHWVLLDYGSVIVHVFTPPEREFYQLERHWGEAKTILRVQ